MIDMLIEGRMEEIATLRASVPEQSPLPRDLVARMEAAVAANPKSSLVFDDTGRATLDAAGHRFDAGRFTLASIGALRSAALARRAGTSHRARLSVLLGADPLTDIGLLQAHSAPGTLFQVASQFNCLESRDPGLASVASYFSDPTQGPRASISAFPGTLLRHYAAPADDGSRFTQTDDRQLDLLAKALPPSVGRVIGGYLTSDGLPDFEAAADALETNFEKICVGLHDDVEVVFGANWRGGVMPRRRIGQAFTSTFAGGGYSGTTRIEGAVERICRSALRAAYLGTVLGAASLGRQTVVLTLIGGGVFDNPHALIWDSLSWALKEVDGLLSAPLHVVLNGREIAPTVSHATLLKATAERGGTVVDVHGGVARPRFAATR